MFTTASPHAFFTVCRWYIGSGWNSFTDIDYATDWQTDAQLTDGYRWSPILYTSNGAGGRKQPEGHGHRQWLEQVQHRPDPGLWLGDGKQLADGGTPAGELRLSNSNGAGNGGPTRPAP